MRILILYIVFILSACSSEPQPTTEEFESDGVVSIEEFSTPDKMAPEQLTIQEEVLDKLYVECIQQISELEDRRFEAERDGDDKAYEYIQFKIEQLEERCR